MLTYFFRAFPCPDPHPNSRTQRGQSEAPRKSSSIPAQLKSTPWFILFLIFPPFSSIQSWQHLFTRGIHEVGFGKGGFVWQLCPKEGGEKIKPLVGKI